jgi:hypothetical protein
MFGNCCTFLGFTNKAGSERLDKLVAENAALAKEKEALVKEVEELKIQMEYRSLKGDFDMRDCKILHFKWVNIMTVPNSCTYNYF